MIITVDPGERIEIAGVAADAVVRYKGSGAEIAIRTADLLVSPRLTGLTLSIGARDWQVSTWRAEGPVCIYTLKEVPRVPPAA